MVKLTSQALKDHSQRWWHLSSIQLAGGIISLPMISAGSHLILTHGVYSATLSILLGNLFILVISYVVIKMSFTQRLNAVENAKRYIGVMGSKLFAVFILISALGWSGWILLSGTELLKNHPVISSFSDASIVGAVASFVLLIGIRGLKRLTLFAILPLLALLVFFVSESTPQPNVIYKTGSLFSLYGIAFVIALNIGSVMDYPTFFRHSKTMKEALIAIGVIFLVTSLVEMAGFILLHPYLHQDHYNLWTTLFVVLSMTTGVCWNIYAASVGWESLFPIFKDRTEYALIGLLITILILNVQQETLFSFAASHVDVMICSLGGTFIALYLFYGDSPPVHKWGYLYRNLVWCSAGLFSILVCLNAFVTSIDCTFLGISAGFISTFILSKLLK